MKGRKLCLVLPVISPSAREAEVELKEQEEKYRVLFNNVSDAIFVHEISLVHH